MKGDGSRSTTVTLGGGPVRSPAPVASLPDTAFAPGAKEPADWERYLTAAIRHRWFVLSVVVLGTLAGIAATRLLDAQYAAQAVLWIEPDNPDQRRAALGPDAIAKPEGWIDLVRSQAVLGPVVRQLRLYVHPASPDAVDALAGFRLADEGRAGRYVLTTTAEGRFTLRTEEGEIVDRGTIGDSIGADLGFEWAPAAAELPANGEIAFAVARPYEEALALARSLDVSIDPGGAFVRIGLEGESRARVSATLNGVADRVVAVAADLKREKLEALTAILADRHVGARQQLREAEADLSAFRVDAVDEIAAGGPPVGRDAGGIGGAAADRALEWRVELDELRRERQALERVVGDASAQDVQIGALSALRSVQTFPPLQLALDDLTQQHAEMRALRNRYREASAPVQELQASIDRLSQETIPVLIRQLIAELRERESDLRPRVDSAFGNLRRVPAMSLQQARLEREVAATERLYAEVRGRYEQAQLELASSVPDVQVLDPAVEPHRPMEGFAPLIIGLSLLTSLGLAIAAATIWDHRDPKVRYPAQVTRDLRMDIVGAVPHVDHRRARSGTAGELEVVESIRALRHRLHQARSPDGALTLTVTSPGMGDGKSFVSLNLALSYAYAGYQTLLIDGDVRRGGQHRALDVPLQPGLTDVLTDRAPMEVALRGTPYPNLSLLPAGTRMHRAPELLESQELIDLLARLRLTYAVIIVDSPPLQAGIDPLVLTTATINGILVMRAGSTEIPATLSKLDSLHALPVRLIGVVLNDVRDGSAFREYTYDLRGYELPDEDRPQLLGGRR